MSFTNLLKIGLILLILFALGETIFTFQKYGKNIFKPKPGSCKILEEKFCNKTALNHFKGFTVIVGNLPVGTQIFAPFDGQVATGKINQPSPYQGFTVSMSDHGVIYNFNGDFKPLTSTGKAGTPIATMTDTGAKNFNGAYNFEFEILKPNDAKTDLVSAEDIERKLFPR